MMIYLVTFYLFDNIEKKILESLMRIILLLKGKFDNFEKCMCKQTSIFSIFVLC